MNVGDKVYVVWMGELVAATVVGHVTKRAGANRRYWKLAIREVEGHPMYAEDEMQSGIRASSAGLQDPEPPAVGRGQ